MHSYPKLEWKAQDLVVSIRPSGIKGWFIARNIYPYIPGNILHFTLLAYKTKSRERKFNCTWNLLRHFPSGGKELAQSYEGSFTSSPCRTVKTSCGSARIITSGQYTLLLQIGTDGEKLAQTMAFITAFSGSKVLWAIYSVGFTGIGFLIRYLFFG